MTGGRGRGWGERRERKGHEVRYLHILESGENCKMKLQILSFIKR